MSKPLPLKSYCYSLTERLHGVLAEPPLVDLDTGRLTEYAHIMSKPEHAIHAPFTAECIEYARLVRLVES